MLMMNGWNEINDNQQNDDWIKEWFICLTLKLKRQSIIDWYTIDSLPWMQLHGPYKVQFVQSIQLWNSLWDSKTNVNL